MGKFFVDLMYEVRVINYEITELSSNYKFY